MESKKTDIKIKTPYGEKNWSFVKKCFDSHDALIEALKRVVEREFDLDPESRNYWDDELNEWQQLIKNAEKQGA